MDEAAYAEYVKGALIRLRDFLSPKFLTGVPYTLPQEVRGAE